MRALRWMWLSLAHVAALGCGDDTTSKALVDAGTALSDDSDDNAGAGDDDADADDDSPGREPSQDDARGDDDAPGDDAPDDDTSEGLGDGGPAADDDLADDDTSPADDDLADDDGADDDLPSTEDDDADDDTSPTDPDAGGAEGDDEPATVNPGGPMAPTYGTGTRLRALVYRGPDGAETFAGSFYDSMFDTRCNFYRTGEDDAGPVYHCIAALPTLAEFASMDCSTPIIEEPTCPANATVVRTFESVVSGCPPAEQLFELGESVGSPEVFQRSPSTLECVSQGETSSEYFALLPFVPSRYVEGREQVVVVDEQRDFGQRFIVGSDGSFVLSSSVVGDSPCYNEPTSPDTTRGYCMPTDVVGLFNEQYANDQCRGGRVVGVDEPRCSPFSASERAKVYAPDLRGCYRLESVYQVGDELAAGTLYEANDDQCTLGPEYDHVFALGDEVPLDDFAALETVNLGDGRVTSQFTASADGSLHDLGAWYDTELEVPCQPRPFLDGVTRCVPQQAAYTGLYYEDDACTVELYEAFAEDVCAPVRERWFAVTTSYQECAGTVVDQVFELTEYEGDVYTRYGDGCVAANPESDGRLVFAATSPLLPGDLTTLELVESP